VSPAPEGDDAATGHHDRRSRHARASIRQEFQLGALAVGLLRVPIAKQIICDQETIKQPSIANGCKEQLTSPWRVDLDLLEADERNGRRF
jgi:hypothetical protein